MKITTIVPVERTFNIQLTENELKLLGVLVGNASSESHRRIVQENRFVSQFQGVKWVTDYTHTVYSNIVEALK